MVDGSLGFFLALMIHAEVSRIHSTSAPKITAESESPGLSSSMNALAASSAPRILSPSMLAEVSIKSTTSAFRLLSRQTSWMSRMAVAGGGCKSFFGWIGDTP